MISSYNIITLCLFIGFVFCIPTPVEKYYEQHLDHFDFQTNPQTYMERYLYLDIYWKTDGPIFFYTGNEGDIESFYDNSGFVFELAQSFGALVIFAEHRFYGKSRPFGSVHSYDTGRIGLLNVEQVLSDYLELITFLKDSLKVPNAIVITFGGSYGGSLSAYMRMRYPQIVDASLAASAPILLYEGETDSNAFFKVVTDDFRMADPLCPKEIVKAFTWIQSLAQSGKFDEIASGLRLCNPPQSQNDVSDILFWARNAFTYLAMLDYPYPTDFLSPLPAWPVKAACNIMTVQKEGLLDRLSQTVGIFYNGTDNLPCFNITAEFFVCADASGCGGSRSDPDALSWDYEACTEIIHNIGTNGVTDMFPSAPWSLENLTAYCQQHWGVSPRPHWMPMNTNLKTSSRIIFSNGDLDPWHAGGVLKSLSPSLIAIRIAEGAHHLDLRGTNPLDPPSVTIARQQEAMLLKQWISEIQLERNITTNIL